MAIAVAFAAVAGTALSAVAWTIGLWLADGRVGASWLSPYKPIAVCVCFGVAVWHLL